MKQPTIEQDMTRFGRPGFLLKAPFDEEFGERLKAAIPQRDRGWWPEKSGWWVAAEHRELMMLVVFKFFTSAVLIGKPGEDDEIISRDGSSVTQGRFL